MTMLDRMRRHRNWLKWSLGLVCLAFVIFYIPDFLRDPALDAAPQGSVAVVEGREISAEEFRRTYQAQIQAYRNAYGSSMSMQLLKQLGVDQQILMQLVDERAALAEAERLKISTTDAEVRQRILLIPAFQENGVFIGEHAFIQGRVNGRCIIGQHVWIGPQTYLDARDLVIEDYVGWGPGAKALGSQHTGQPSDMPIITTDLEIKPVHICAWADIGVNAIVMPGITVGKGAIVGAGAVVTHDVEPFSIVAGVPARLLRRRGDARPEGNR
jgi:acetyltransferase-like isoleucine patch superfamily enzyme